MSLNERQTVSRERQVVSAADIQGARLNLGMSRAQLAEAVGVTPAVIKYIEAGGRPIPSNARKVADYFGTTVLDLWPLEDAAA